jgi:chemosensory pili system protein ChpC
MNEATTSVRCMLLPLNSLNLLIPNSAVAEIIGYSAPRALDGCSDWFPGVVLWRGVYVPVIAIEQMCAVASAGVGPRSRIAIIYNPEKDPDLPYLGIHMQDIPRAYLADPETTVSGGSEGLSEYLLTRVDDEEQARVIPDVDKIIAALKLEYNPARLDELKS